MSEVRVSAMLLTDVVDVLNRIADGQQVDRPLVRQVLGELEWARQNAAGLQSSLPAKPEASLDTAIQDDLQEKVTKLEEQLVMRGQTIQRQPEYLALQRELTALRDRIHQPSFWTAEFAANFAESLQDMEEAQQLLEFADEEDVLQAFDTWHTRMREGVEQLFSRGFNQPLVEGLRRDLIVQWVFLRWLELTHLEGDLP